MDGLEFYNPLEGGEQEAPTADAELQKVIDEFPVDEEPTDDVETPIEDTPLQQDLEPEAEPEPIEVEESFSGVANYLSESGLITSVPEGMDLDNFKKEDLIALVKHNLEAGKATTFEEGFKTASEKLATRVGDGFAQKILSYKLDNPNADDNDVQAFAGSLMYAQDITSLTVEANSEQIVREYYKSLDWDSNTIDKKIVQLTALSADALAEEASILKPKLDVKANGIATEKLEQSKRLKEFEDSLQSNLHDRTVGTLNTGKLNGVELSQEQAKFLYAAVMNNDTPVNVRGKNIEMGFAEALIRNAKYNPKSNMEDLMLGLLVIQEGAGAIEKFYAKPAKTKAAEEFAATFKFSNNKKKATKVEAHEELNTGLKFNIN